jgi:DNA mismatch endonuclease, patch repair protein
VRNKDTKPEKIVRSMLHRLGYRFGMHGKKLPGKPDIVLTRYKKVVFVHGCFWHRHGICRELSIPESNPEKWAKKFEDNVRRDREKLAALKEAGWDVLVVWECEIGDHGRMERRLRSFMKKRNVTPPCRIGRAGRGS